MANGEKVLRDESTYIVFSETQKEIFGTRPDMNWLRGLSDEDFITEWEKLANACEAHFSEEKAREEAAVVLFEAHIARIMGEQSVDRDKAIQIDLKQMNISKADLDFYGMGLYAFNHGLPTSYFGEALPLAA